MDFWYFRNRCCWRDCICPGARDSFASDESFCSGAALVLKPDSYKSCLDDDDVMLEEMRHHHSIPYISLSPCPVAIQTTVF